MTGDQTRTLRAILAQISVDVRSRQPPAGVSAKVVAIDGPGGAGKSTFAAHLSPALDNCQIVRTDDFASWDNPIDWWPELIATVLRPITRGEPARFLPSRWGPDHVPEPVEIVPADLFILEGVTASRDVFRPYLTYTIWIDAPSSVRLARGLQRNGGSSREQWIEWMAGEERYRAREHPDERADLALPGDDNLWD
jgi:hypothetical protein